MVEVKNSTAFPQQQLAELSLSLNERQRSQIFPIQIEQIERDEDALRLSKEKIFEDWPAFAINAGNLAIEHGRFSFQVIRQPLGEFSKSAERVSATPLA
jgi:hypothetical protein